MMLVAGLQGFGFADPHLVAVALEWSGNAVLRAERDNAGPVDGHGVSRCARRPGGWAAGRSAGTRPGAG